MKRWLGVNKYSWRKLELDVHARGSLKKNFFIISCSSCKSFQHTWKNFWPIDQTSDDSSFFFNFTPKAHIIFWPGKSSKVLFWNSEVMIQRCKAIKKVMDLACSPSLQAFLSPSFSQDQSTQADLKRYLLLFVIFWLIDPNFLPLSPSFKPKSWQGPGEERKGTSKKKFPFFFPSNTQMAICQSYHRRKQVGRLVGWSLKDTYLAGMKQICFPRIHAISFSLQF